MPNILPKMDLILYTCIKFSELHMEKHIWQCPPKACSLSLLDFFRQPPSKTSTMNAWITFFERGYISHVNLQIHLISNYFGECESQHLAPQGLWLEKSIPTLLSFNSVYTPPFHVKFVIIFSLDLITSSGPLEEKNDNWVGY